MFESWIDVLRLIAPIILVVVLSVMFFNEGKEPPTWAVVALLLLFCWQLYEAVRFLILVIPRSGPFFSNLYLAGPFAVLLAVILYRLRGRYPFVYGMIEIFVALIATGVAILTPSDVPLNKIVTILGGIYIFVRGLDNVDKGLPDTWRPWWTRCFPKATLAKADQAPKPTADAEGPIVSS
jgi:hypothetical protein